MAQATRTTHTPSEEKAHPPALVSVALGLQEADLVLRRRHAPEFATPSPGKRTGTS